MQKEKRKNNSVGRLSPLALIFLWGVGYAIGFGALWLILKQLDTDPFGLIGQIFRYWDRTSIVFLFGLIVPTLLQTLLVKQVLRGSLRPWINLTGVGIIITCIILLLAHVLILEPRKAKTLSLEFLIPVLFIPVALAQTIWFVQRIKRAWLWPLTSIIGTVLVFITLYNVTEMLFGFISGGMLYGLLMGFMMFYLHIDVLGRSEPS